MIWWLLVRHCCCLTTLTAALAHGDRDGGSRRKCRPSRRASAAEAAAVVAARQDSEPKVQTRTQIVAMRTDAFGGIVSSRRAFVSGIGLGASELGEEMDVKEIESSCRHRYVHVASICPNHNSGD